MSIPIITARGSHYEVGFQIGVAARDSLDALYHATLKSCDDRLSTWRTQVPGFLTAAEEHLPQIVQELRGCAAGSGVPFQDLFLLSVEELLCGEVKSDLPNCGNPESTPKSPALTRGERRGKGCTDLAAAPPATTDGNIWLAHNNDLGRDAEEHVFVTRFCVTGQPDVLAVTIGGIFISIGFNRAGIGLTGNQLSANDSRVGIPRQLIARAILESEDFESALQTALLPERASSYNNLIAARSGELVNVEASATDHELIWAKDGVTFHTNHYLSPHMLQFEQSQEEVPVSEMRCSRARDYAERYHGKMSQDICERFLRDHVFQPWSVCKHGYDSVTVFSSMINLTEQKMWLARGNPCTSRYALFTMNEDCANTLISKP